VRAADRTPCATCVSVILGAADVDAVLPTVDRLDGVRLFVRVDDPAAAAAGEGRLAEVRRRGGRAGVALPLSGTADIVPRGADVVVIDARERGGTPEERAFRLKVLATAVRARVRAAQIGVLVSDAGDLQGYVDFVLPEARRVATAAGVYQAVFAAGTETVLIEPDPANAISVVGALAALAPVVPSGMAPLGDVSAACPAAAPCDARSYLQPQTLDAVLVIRPRASVDRITIRPRATRVDAYLPSMPGIPVRDLPIEATQDGSAVRVPAGETPFVLRVAGWRDPAAPQFVEDVRVVAARDLGVEEIVARHQAAAARQERAIGTLVSVGHTALTFQAPGFAGPVTIEAETTMFRRSAPQLSEVAQSAIRVNGLRFANRGSVPRLPIVEPERVTAPPLAITLGRSYDYRLEGREEVRGRACYVVSFVPREQGGTLVRGRAWIAADTFALVRAHGVQTGLRGPVVSSEQRDDYAPWSIGDEELWLLSESETHQMYEGAGHRTPIHRLFRVSEQVVNSADFEARLARVHASDAVMLRETAAGLRYLQKPRDGGEERTVVQSAGDRVRTIAFGVLVDPNISRPLPFAGLSYVDFNWLRPGGQLSAFIGGTYGQVAWMLPALGRPRVQIGGSAFAIASEFNDRSFRGGVERYDENLRQRPARATVSAGLPFGDRVRVRVGYELEFTVLRAADTTSAAFVVPPDLVVHGARVALELQHGPWTSETWWNPAWRQGWRAWGFPPAGGSDYDPSHSDFQRFGTSLTRSVVAGRRTVGRLELAAMGGRDLDRFSRFGFGSFDNRLRGYPSASIRYDWGALARTALAWTAAPRLRLDVFVDQAVVRDPGFGSRARGYTGVGAAAEAPAPFGLLLAAEWGYGVHARDADGGRGAHVVRITGYKIF
jgi:hypothetical protein